jgi:hypothetical protein
MVAGAGLPGVAGVIFGVGSAVGGYWAEAAACSSFGLGLLVFAFALMAPRRRIALSVAGLALAAAGGAYWAFAPLAHGHVPQRWALVGVGLFLGAVAALLHWLLHDQRATLAWGFPVAFGIVFIASVEIVRAEWGFNVWFLADVLVALGAALLAFRSGRTFGSALAGEPSA